MAPLRAKVGMPTENQPHLIAYFHHFSRIACLLHFPAIFSSFFVVEQVGGR